MMKRLFTIALLLAFSLSMMAEHVDRQKAAKVAETVLPDRELTLLPTEKFDHLYVFTGESGFVMVAADDCAKPVLAYSIDFPFRFEDMPENIQSWLESLNAEIQQAVDKKLEASDEIRLEWELLSQGKMPEPKHRTAVAPLVKTHWNQHEPYNNYCPGGSLTGCVATAMAQVMKYWEWPNKGMGSHSYDHATYGPLSVNFSNTTYDWDNMVDKVYDDSPEAQQRAVATLMYHCGVAVEMDYGLDYSTAYTSMIVSALIAHFDYNSSTIQLRDASDYNTASWLSCLKTELDNGRPMVYRGQSSGGGHAFVCDGYDANDMLHFNWGWGGYCDGYFAYGALNPGSGGAGSGSGSYNEQNYAITGIRPNTPSLAAPGNFSASAADRKVTLQWSSVSGASRYKVYRDGFVIKTNVSGTSYTDSNVSYGNHRYAVRAVKSNGDYSLLSEQLLVAVTYPGPVPANVMAVAQGDDVQLSWTAPASENAQLKYGEETNSSSSYGSSDGGFTWGQRYTSDQLSAYAGMAITSVDFCSWKTDSYRLTIYKEVNGVTESLVSGTFSISSPGWYTVNLPNPIPIDYENNLIVSFYNDCSTYQYVAAFMKDYEGSDNARLFLDEGYWYTIDNTISWLIRMNITDDTYTYSIYRNGQQIATNITQTSYNDNNLPDGYYQYTVRTKYYGSLSDPSNTAPVIIGSSGYAISNVTVTEPTCHGGNDGEVSVKVTGGYYPLTFELGSQTVTVSEDHYVFQNVSAGEYSLKVIDNMGFALARQVNVSEPEGLSTGSIGSGTESIANGGTCSTIQSVQDATTGQASLTYRWKQNGSVLGNSNTAQYTPRSLSPGTYTFIREVKDPCTDWTPSEGTWKVLVSPNDVNENGANRLTVYPNPTNGKITVRGEQMESISVVSVTGQRMAMMEVDNDHAEVNLSDLHPGVYVLVVHTRNGVNRVRVIRD